ncbi:RICIN domain-containing protein [Streptomyces hoynatensis]|uniref:Ricin B lectin domain-containing protein n=1 Tax=Streptomyces hoynatensis TaxID=1141874 RepID=A0A3A9YP95_9ACTN|nr:RICIN domain-containing protein [Streptomyces hoynatensis]RKN37908.1 hypothetical protein D7294_26440 [Streptomyces hoynatensis]
MVRRLLGAASAVVAGLALSCGQAAAAAPDRAELPVLLADTELSAYATAGGDITGPADDRYVRMLPATGTDAQRWEPRALDGGATALVSLATGGCLTADPAAATRFVTTSPCDGGAAQSWDLKTGDAGTLLVNRGLGACLTRPSVSTVPPVAEDRLSVAACDGSEEQTFRLVV